MRGKDNDADPARAYPGNRPSTTILLDDVTPEVLGALIAFYEHRTFANAVLMFINPFDQFGVELGKEIAMSIDAEVPIVFDPSTLSLIYLALCWLLREFGIALVLTPFSISLLFFFLL